MFGPVTNDAEAVIVHAADEASRRGDRRIGTDHLLLGLLHDPGVARTLGTDIEHARAAAHHLDDAALAALGINLETMPDEHAPRSAGRVPWSSGLRTVPLTSAFRAVMARAVAIARDEKTRKAEPRHILAALLERRPPDPATALLAALGIDRQRLSPRRPVRAVAGRGARARQE